MASALDVAKQLENIVLNDIPFAISRAMEETVKSAVDDSEDRLRAMVKREAEGSSNDDLSPSLRKKGHNKGAIRGQWPSKKDIQAGGSDAFAKVFVVNNSSSGSARDFDLIDEFHPLVYGGTVNKVPQGKKPQPAVITPTTAVMKGLSGQGRLKKLNVYGNIAGLKSGLLKRLKEKPEEYLNVTLNSSNIKYKHLAPGLYFRGREISKGGTLSDPLGKKVIRRKIENGTIVLKRQKARQTALSKRGKSKVAQGKIVNYLVMLLAYHTQRTYKGRWDFPDDVRGIYVNEYAVSLSKHITKAISTSKVRFK